MTKICVLKVIRTISVNVVDRYFQRVAIYTDRA